MTQDEKLERAAELVTMADQAELVEGEPVTYTVVDKLRSLLAIVLSPQRAHGAGPSAAAFAMLRMANRMGLTSMVASLFPPLDDSAEAEWHSLLELVVGCALQLPSDGHELDIERARLIGAAAMEAFTELDDDQAVDE